MPTQARSNLGGEPGATCNGGRNQATRRTWSVRHLAIQGCGRLAAALWGSFAAAGEPAAPRAADGELNCGCVGTMRARCCLGSTRISSGGRNQATWRTWSEGCLASSAAAASVTASMLSVSS
jgi:hypothetical protein